MLLIHVHIDCQPAKWAVPVHYDILSHFSIATCSVQYHELLHEWARGIFTYRRRVKMQPTSAMINIYALMSIIKCLSITTAA